MVGDGLVVVRHPGTKAYAPEGAVWNLLAVEHDAGTGDGIPQRAKLEYLEQQKEIAVRMDHLVADVPENTIRTAGDEGFLVAAFCHRAG
jgi:hypothetical protein